MDRDIWTSCMSLHSFDTDKKIIFLFNYVF